MSKMYGRCYFYSTWGRLLKMVEIKRMGNYLQLKTDTVKLLFYGIPIILPLVCHSRCIIPGCSNNLPAFCSKVPAALRKESRRMSLSPQEASAVHGKCWKQLIFSVNLILLSLNLILHILFFFLDEFRAAEGNTTRRLSYPLAVPLHRYGTIKDNPM